MAGATNKPTSSNTSISDSNSNQRNSFDPGLLYVNNIIENPLDNFASYNYNLSLAVMDDETFNEALYKNRGPQPPYLAYSGNRYPTERVPTLYGEYDYFIDNLVINHLVGFDAITGNTNAIGFEFKVIEPYSLGLFFIALQQQALAKGHLNYLDAPLLMTLEFKGNLAPGPENSAITGLNKKYTRYFPLKLREIDMNVTERGCEYSILAYPVNEGTFERTQDTLTTDVSLRGKSVGEMLSSNPDKSLQSYLQNKANEQKKQKIVAVPDEYYIEFPDVNGQKNPFKDVEMGFGLYNGRDTPFADDNFIFENGVYKRGNIQIDPNVSEFRFAQSTSVINAINQVILLSNYARDVLETQSEDGFVVWWRVETEMKYISNQANMTYTGVKPKKYIFRIVPYRVSASYFLPPNTSLKGVPVDKKIVVKEYNYIYSGDNTSILNFDINFKTGFYTALSADALKNNQDLTQKGEQSFVSDDDASLNGTQLGQGSVSSIQGYEHPTRQNFVTTGTSNDNTGGSSLGGETPGSLAAKQFHQAITSGVDMINVEMEILGDPFYISDSGMGNEHTPATSNPYVNESEAMAWDNGEIHITVNFKTPTDINLETGMYDFNNLYKVSQFSGLYRVIRGRSTFSGGKFTQTLNIIRLRGQEAEFGLPGFALKPKIEEIVETVQTGAEIANNIVNDVFNFNNR